MKKSFVAVLMGSASDAGQMQGAAELLRKLQIPCEMRVLSAHRTPDRTREYVRDAEQRGCAVFIAAAGMAAHLAGAVAAQTVRPVIGVPLDASGLGGLDSLLSTVQMPPGMPVATVAIGAGGAKNAALLAAQILALEDGKLAVRLRQEREERAKAVIQADTELQKKY